MRDAGTAKRVTRVAERHPVDAAPLAATRRPANELGVPISIHLSESPYEVQYAKDNYGMTSIDAFESIDFFQGPTIAAHVVWPTATETQ